MQKNYEIESNNYHNSIFKNHNMIQKNLMKENIIIINENDEPMGFDTKKNSHLMTNINSGYLHRAFSVFLFNSNNELLIQQRSSDKILFPLFWANTCCSHPLFNENEIIEENHKGIKYAAIRKLKQELGIDLKNIDLSEIKFITRIHYKAAYNTIWGEHEIDYILFIKTDTDIKINHNEVCNIKWVDKENLKQLVNNISENKMKFSPWFLIIYKNFLNEWWDKLLENKLYLIENQTNIHRL